MSLDELTKSRKSTKGSITRITNFIENFDVTQGNILEVFVREDQLNSSFKKYDQIQTNLEALDYDVHSQDRDLVEPKYYSTLAKIATLRNGSPVVTAEPPQAHARPNVSVKLPTLNIPTFTGDYHSWSAFKDLFSSLVHNDPTLSNVQKMCYLKSSLKNEPKQIIDSLIINNENYEPSWKLLNDRYENKYLLVNSHIKAILELNTTSKATVSQLRELTLTVKQHMNSLEALQQDVSSWDILIIYILNQKVDNQTRKAWELQRTSPDIPTLKEYFAFLEHRSNALELSTDSSPSPAVKKTSTHVVSSTQVNNASKNCPLCKQDHVLQDCPAFLKQAVEERYKTVKSLRLCSNCFRPSHRNINCRASNCRKCQRRHNTLLHFPTNATKNPSIPELDPIPSCSDSRQANITALHVRKQPTQVLLCTAKILVRDISGKLLECRALLDSGSQANFVKASLVQKLNIKPYRCRNTVTSITDTAKRIENGVSIQIASRITAYQQILEFSILEKITLPLPHVHVNTEHWSIPNHIQFADPTFYKPDEIDMLIGAEIFLDIIQNGHYSLGRSLPTLRNTVFGWIVSGTVPIEQSSLAVVSFHSLIEIQETIAKFWRLEEVTNKPILSLEEKQCEKIFRETIARNSSGRYIVSLPLIPNYEHLLGSSYQQAVKQFLTLERRFANNISLHEDYKKFIQEYLALGHAVRVEPINLANSPVAYYLPHHAVIKPDSLSTKLRVVFNASMPTTSGKSLNDLLLVGPTIQSDLFDIILRFRTHLYVFTTDIIKMFRQITVQPANQPLLRIIWRDKSCDPLQIIQLTTVTYGTACAPYLAQRCLNQLAEDEGAHHPLAAEMLKRDTYMDDILSGSDSPEAINLLKNELTELLAKGGFHLHKWRSNLASFDTSQEPSILNNGNPIVNEQSIKALGLIWNPSKDTFALSVPSDIPKAGDTKRQVLSFISKIFDPLGLIAPVSIRAKLLLQRMWAIKLDWDERLPEDIVVDWHKFKLKLPSLQLITIDRSLFANSQVDNIQLHCFCDASMAAYGACLYLRVSYLSGTTLVRLICSKSRVAPLKTISIPRLELCGAVLLSRLTSKVYNILSTIKIDSVHLWTDSSIVLAWINSPSNKWATFVSHRVAEIQELTSQFSWNYVASAQNPADSISRGVEPDELIDLQLWWNGPEWLREVVTSWPQKPAIVKGTLPEQRKVVTLARINFRWSEIFERFSKLSRLIHTFAYINRFIDRCRNKITITGLFSVEELTNSLHLILKLVQQESFLAEIELLKQGKPLSGLKKSPIKQLNPFLDASGLIRVGGRLENAKIPFNQKHPILLPANNLVTKLIIKQEHIKLLHAGIQTVLANLRLKYWPINAKRTIKHVILKCITCHRYKATPLTQIMADLPEERVVPTRAFQCVGVDYAGPITVKLSTLRRALTSKGYIAVFVCLTSKAVHLELVSELTTKAFIAALSRFVARRGRPSLIYSDNGTNFKGADNEMKRLYELQDDQDHLRTVDQFASTKEIRWKYIPPNSPSWGGLWEAAVKSVKFHLVRTVGMHKLTFEQLTTLLCQIESVLNSRPLCALSNDPNDYTYLSPCHFLIGDYMNQLPEEDLTNKKIESLKVFSRITKMRQDFWSKWKIDYLSMLQQRPKWHVNQPDLTPNTLVLIRDDGVSPGAWSLGRVMEVYPGKDGRVRVALVKTPLGTYKRPIVKLAPLPGQEAEI